MKFNLIEARPNWRELAQKLGYLSTTLDNPPYWIEALEQPFCAVFDVDEITQVIEPATKETAELALKAVDAICNSKDSDAWFDRLKTPPLYREAIRKSWNRQDPSLYGRIDFSYNNGQLKVLELNFDGAITVYEAALFQLMWLDEMRALGQIGGDALQSNSLHDHLLRAFDQLFPSDKTLHFVCPGTVPEEDETVRYLQSCAVIAKRRTKFLKMQDLGHNSDGQLVDLDDEPIEYLVKLYPWELLFREDLKVVERTGKSVLVPIIESQQTHFFEPVWRYLLCNKGILPILHELAPNSQWLLPSALDGTPEAQLLKQQPYARKPIFGMQGANVSIHYPDEPHRSVDQPGQFGREGYVIQELFPLPKFNDYHIVLGSWLVGNESVGVGIRADLSAITTGAHCLFVPHYVVEPNH